MVIVICRLADPRSRSADLGPTLCVGPHCRAAPAALNAPWNCGDAWVHERMVAANGWRRCIQRRGSVATVRYHAESVVTRFQRQLQKLQSERYKCTLPGGWAS